MLCYAGKYPDGIKVPQNRILEALGAYPFDVCSPPRLLGGERNVWISGWRIIYFVMDGCLQHTFLSSL